MNNTFFTSDLHFGHSNIIKYDNRPFHNIEEMDTVLIKKWNNKVDKNDTVYILGDISWYNDDKTFDIYNQLNGHKRLIKGNHDRLHGKVKNCFESIKDYDEINISNKTLVMSHYPIHFYNHHYHGAIMLYAHVHNSHEEVCTQQIRQNLIQNDIPCEMYNVGCMNWNYEPVTLEEILSKNK
jgi:calcineurin-like phosphoesterase family protein